MAVPHGAAQPSRPNLGVFYVADYGAIGDGVENDRLALQLAITAASDAGGGLVNGAGRSYRVDSTLFLPSGVRLEDMDLDASNWTEEGTILEATGSEGSAVLLSNDASQGATSIVVADASGLVADGWIKVYSTSAFGSTSQPRGEICRIASVVGTTINLQEPLADSYATADGASIKAITFVEEIAVERVRIVGPTDNTLSIIGIALDRVRSVSLRDVSVRQTHHAGISLTDAVGVSVVGCHFDKIEKTGLAYGVMVLFASQDVTIAATTGQRMRHLVTIGGGTSRAGIPRRIAVTGCVSSQSISSGFDCHPAGEDISFIGNHVAGSDAEGITFQAARGVISGNTVRDSGTHGILVQPLTIKPHDVVVSDNTILRSGSRGILVTTTALYTNFQGFVIADNSIQVASGVGAPGIEVNGANATITGLTVSGNLVRGSISHQISIRSCNYVSIVGNTVEIVAASTHGIRLLTVTRASVVGNSVKSTSTTSTRGIILSGSDDCTVAGNTIADCGIGILTDATSDNNAITGNNVRGNTTPLSIAGTGNTDTGNII